MVMRKAVDWEQERKRGRRLIGSRKGNKKKADDREQEKKRRRRLIGSRTGNEEGDCKRPGKEIRNWADRDQAR